METLNDFYFLRHGETDWNRDHRGMGQQDIPLNQKGEAQAMHAVQWLKQEPISLICHSSLIRARSTALIISQALAVPICEVPELKECCWGVMEGETKGKWTDDWVAGNHIDGAESFDEFTQRVRMGLLKALSQEESILIVAHGGVFWAIQKILKLPAQDNLPNCVPVLVRAPPRVDLPWSIIPLHPDQEI